MNVGYARAAAHNQDLQPQLDELKAASCEQIFVEHPARARDRPKLQTCLAALRAGDTLVVWSLDRLARSLRDLIEIIDDLNRRDIGFRSLSEGIDTSGKDGEFLFHLFGALAEFEHSLIRERTIDGLAAARARGRKGGRKPALSAEDVCKAAAMLQEPGVTKTEVAKHFRVSRVTLNAALARQVGTGSGAAIETAA
ncbi:recombinase family protein [Pseudoxanthomonas mexicana]